MADVMFPTVQDHPFVPTPTKYSRFGHPCCTVLYNFRVSILSSRITV